MLRNVGALLIVVAISTSSLHAADLPEIMVGPGNAVPQCVTPGRLMAFLKQRNPGFNPRYDGLATQYMRFGEQLGIRWDFAFYQMIVETGALRYNGDVKPDQFNFAGLGATGRGERGESFKDIETGVLAHLQHILLYAGRPVPNPVAERTRKVHEWGTLTAWQQSFRRPLTFGDLSAKWSGNRSYASMLQTVAERFQSDACHGPDPHPELVQEARALIAASAAKTAEAAEPPALSPGKELAQRAIAEARADGTDKRYSLGAPPAQTAPAPTTTRADPVVAAPQAAAPSAPYKVPASEAPRASATPVKAAAAAPKADAAAEPAAAKAAAPAEKANARVALAGAAAAPGAKTLLDAAVPPAANQKCRVWTASYGGQKSIIIRHVADQVVNFTVLDVNTGAETREAEAFIAAYAKNGKMIAGAYENQALALDKAFELCPEG